MTLGLIEKNILTREMFEKMMGREKSEQVRPKIDALLLPSMPYPAPPRTADPSNFLSIAYCAIFNYFSMPAGTVPVTQVTAEEAKWNPGENEPDDRLAQALKCSIEGATGLPLGVQIAALPYCDEHVIRLLHEIEGEVNFDARPSV